MIDSILDASEKVIWEDRPNKLLYIIGDIKSSVGIIIFAVAAYFLVDFLMGADNGKIMMVFSLGFILFLFAGIIYRIFNWKKVRYLFTDKRIYIESGIVGRDIEILELTDVKEPSVAVGFLEKYRNCGTILMNPYIDRSKNQHRRTRYAYVFQHIQDPYAVFKILKQLTFDVHADVSYPNASRPAVNQGYETRQNSGEAQDI